MHRVQAKTDLPAGIFPPKADPPLAEMEAGLPAEILIF